MGPTAAALNLVKGMLAASSSGDQVTSARLWRAADDVTKLYAMTLLCGMYAQCARDHTGERWLELLQMIELPIEMTLEDLR